MFSRTVKDPYQGFKFIVEYLNNYHDEFISEDNDVSYLGETIAVHILNPLENHDALIALDCQGLQSFEYYREQLVEGKHTKGFVYTYHGRLNDYFGFNQIEKIVNKLKESPTTRRAVAVTWQPEFDLDSEDPPCMDLLKFSVKHGKLCLSVVFRSHDILKAWGKNVYALAYLMDDIALALDLSIGYLEVISMDPHIYAKADIDLLNKTIYKINNPKQHFLFHRYIYN